MEKMIEITREQFGSVLISAICSDMYLPYQIIDSSIRIPDKIRVTLLEKPTGKAPNFMMVSKGEDYHGVTFSVSKKDIFAALSYEIDLTILGRKNQGNIIKSLSIKLPDKILVKLKFIPRGALCKDYLHQFTGKLR